LIWIQMFCPDIFKDNNKHNHHLWICNPFGFSLEKVSLYHHVQTPNHNFDTRISLNGCWSSLDTFLCLVSMVNECLVAHSATYMEAGCPIEMQIILWFLVQYKI
jgi:hypothetical protein